MERFRVQNAPSVDPGGALAGTNFGADLGTILSNFARSGAALVAPIERGAAAREGLNAGLAGGTERRSEITAAGRIFNEQLQAGFKARTLSQLREGLSKFAAEHPGNTLEDVTAFETKAAELWDGMRSGIPADMQPTFDLEFQERAGRAQAEIRANALANQRRLDIASMKISEAQLLEDAQKAARDGDFEGLALVKERFAESLVTRARIGDIAPDAIQGEMLDFDGSVLAESMLGDFLRRGAPVSMIVALEEGHQGKELSTRQRDALVGKMRAEVSRRRTEARAAAADALIAQTQNGKDAKVLIKKLDAGVPLDPAETARVGQYLDTPGLIPPDVAADLSVSRAVSAGSNALRGMPAGQAQAELAAVEAAGPPATLEDAAYRKKLGAVVDEHTAALKSDDAYAYLVENQQAQPVRLDLSSPDALAATVRGAASRGQVVSAQYGTRISPITMQQGRDIERMMDGLDVGGRAQVLGTLVSEFGADADLVLSRIGQEKTNYSMAGSMMAFGDQPAAERILQATATIEAYTGQGKVLPEPDWKKADIEAAEVGAGWFATVRLADALPDPVVRSAVVSAAHDLMTYERTRNRNLSITEALERVGVSFGNYHDSPIVRPVGVSEAEFADRMGALTAADIERMGGVAGMDPAEVADSIQSGVAELKTLVPGIYEVRIGANVLRRDDGAPFQLEVR